MNKAKQQTVRIMLDDDELFVGGCEMTRSDTYADVFLWSVEVLIRNRVLHGMGHSRLMALLNALEAA